MRPTDSTSPESPIQPASPIRPEKDKSTLRAFVSYLKDYFRIVSIKSLLLTVLFVSLLIVLNYTIGIESRIRALQPWYLSLACFFVFYSGVLAVAWGLQYRRERHTWLLMLAPLYFAFKMIHWDFLPLLPAGWSAPWDRYASIVLQLPVKLLLLLVLVYGCRKTGLLAGTHGSVMGKAPERALWKAVGLTGQGFNARPYFFLLVMLIPVIALASTQHDFLRFYPKVKNMAFINGYAHPAWPWKLLYELSYGLDFLSIELFFRGFLVIGLARWAGPKAILPMAAFYCTVHFGKPLGECISSFAGGLALGVIAWRTRSILGGLMVHLGLAWMMEIGGWLGNLYF